MNTETTKLIEQLAEKLGTTSEYLWSILLKQAPISATVSIIQIISVLLFWPLMYRVHKNLMNEENKITYKSGDGFVGIAMCISCIVLLSLSILIIVKGASNIAYGYLNPEYWALNHLLDKINNN